MVILYDMFCSLFLVFLLQCILLMHSVCVNACPYSAPPQPKNTVDLFVPNGTIVPKVIGWDDQLVMPFIFVSPFLVAADGVLFALADAIYDNDVKSFYIISRHIVTEGNNWAEQITANDGKNWETQLVVQNREPNDKYAAIFETPLAVAKGDKIYLFSVGYHLPIRRTDSTTEHVWNFFLVVGSVYSPTCGGKVKTLMWQLPEPPILTLVRDFREQSLDMIPFGGANSAFLTDDGNIFFVVNAKKENNFVSVIIHLLQHTEVERQLQWSYVETAGGCRFFFFPWERKIFMVTYCQGGTSNVRESTDMGKTWSDSEGPLSRLFDRSQYKGELTTVRIDDRRVLLFTLATNSISGTEQQNVSLGFSDGIRLYEAGQLLADVGKVIFGGFSYTNGELFSLHQQFENGPGNITLTRLKDHLEKIKLVLDVWNKTDGYVLQLCETTSLLDIFLEIPCDTHLLTNGLVGFLSNNTMDTTWIDEYLYVNATVKGGTKVPNGFRFKGRDAGAGWPVGAQGRNQPYSFSTHGLTVVATVTIHSAPENDGSGPLITFCDTACGDNRVGLWYDKDMQLRVISEEAGEEVVGGYWEVNNTCRVALRLSSSDITAYVENNLLKLQTTKKSPPEIGHIFIGGYTENGAVRGIVSHMTVTNVLLYNWPLDVTTLEALGMTLRGPVDNSLCKHFSAYTFFLLLIGRVVVALCFLSLNDC